MVDQPRIGDAFGEIMRAALAEYTGQGLRPTIGGRIPRSVIEIVERDDGMINGAPAARYLCGPDQWQPFDLRALELLDAPTLDIGDLLCTPEELAGLTQSTAWRVEDVDAADAPFYVATLVLA